MVSETAIATLEEFEAKGLKPTPRDVIRLNAIGLKLEAARGKCAADSTYTLPRVAAVSEKLAFRQPTIGHEIWLEKVERLIKEGDYQSELAIHAYALSRPQSELPDADDPQSVKTAVETFAAECRDLTRDQIYAAIHYVTFGADPSAGENPARRKTDEDEDEGEERDFSDCIAIGVLNEGRAALWGLSEADLKNMTTHQLRDVVNRSYFFHNVKRGDDADFWEGRYYATADEIEERLTKEKNG